MHEVSFYTFISLKNHFEYFKDSYTSKKLRPNYRTLHKTCHRVLIFVLMYRIFDTVYCAQYPVCIFVTLPKKMGTILLSVSFHSPLRLNFHKPIYLIFRISHSFASIAQLGIKIVADPLTIHHSLQIPTEDTSGGSILRKILTIAL